MPASAVTVIASRSTSRMPLSRVGLSSVPSGAAIAVKLWPVPTILTVDRSARARSTAARIAAVSAGSTTRSGRADSRPDQFRHSLTAVSLGCGTHGVRGSACAAIAAITPAVTHTR